MVQAATAAAASLLIFFLSVSTEKIAAVNRSEQILFSGLKETSNRLKRNKYLFLTE